jgi:GNAT superfamily N-acetyltransferase
MQSTLTVREAGADDLRAIIGLLAQLYSDPRQESYAEASASYEAAFAAIDSDRRQTLYVAEQDGRIVASAVLIVVPNLTRRGRPYGIVENVITDASERGRGHGEAMMRRIIDDARAAGCHKVALMSRNEREDAHRFNRRLGFEPAHVGFRLDL